MRSCALNFLTLKPMLVVVNVAEDDLDKAFDFGSSTEGMEVISLRRLLKVNWRHWMMRVAKSL